MKIISWNVNMFKPDKPENKDRIILELNKLTMFLILCIYRPLS